MYKFVYSMSSVDLYFRESAAIIYCLVNNLILQTIKNMNSIKGWKEG